ncbi:MAG TPA: hypothetical protein VGM96_24030 [Reyranella sp.]|jgi:hypothetical protein
MNIPFPAAERRASSVPGQEATIRSEEFNPFWCTSLETIVGWQLLVTRHRLARCLLAHGEADLSARAFAVSAADLDRISEAGGHFAAHGLPATAAICRAAIEVMEGEPRSPRKGGSWASVQKAYEVGRRAREASYAGGVELNARGVRYHLGEALIPHLPDFRYFKSHGQFRRPFANGTSYIEIWHEIGSHYLSFGINHRLIEEIRSRLFDKTWRTKPWRNDTIFMSSKYMFPASPHWHYRIEASWPISGTQGVTRAMNEIAPFLDEIVFPYLEMHEDPAAIRETELRRPERGGGSGFWSPHTTVFAIDNLLGQRDWLDEDLEHYRHYYQGPPASKELERHYKMAKKNWGKTSSSVT